MTAAAVDLRPAEVGDAREIAWLQIESSRVGYRGLVADELLARVSDDARADVWRERLESGLFGLVLLAVREGRPAGYCAVLTPAHDADAAADVAALCSIYVDPALWRTGCGRALVNEVVRRLRADGGGWRELTLWVLEGNAGARAFYTSLGFQADGARQFEAAVGVPEIRLRLAL